MDELHLDSVIEASGKYKGMTVQEVVDKKKSAVFQLIKKGLIFDDEVLKMCNITKTIRDRKVINVIVDHDKPVMKKLAKDTASLKDILKEINTLEYYEDEKTKETDENSNPNYPTEDGIIEPNNE